MMLANEYVEQIRKAFRDTHLAEVERLEREFGDREVTYRELEESLSSDVSALLQLSQEQQAYIDFLTEVIFTAVKEGTLELPEELKKDVMNAIKAEEGEMSND